MKKYVLVLLGVLFSLTLTACKDDASTDSSTWVILPDLAGLTEVEITTILDDLQLNYEINYYESQNQQYSLQFIMYEDYNIGDIVRTSDLVKVLIYPQYISPTSIELPDFTGLTKDEIINLMLNSTVSFYFDTVPTDDPDLDNLFIGFVGGYLPGEYFDTISALGLMVYELEVEKEYFQVIDMVYDGPYLDESYASIDYMYPRGGYFEATLKACTDGDTARFNYPSDIYEAITSGAKSVRFLNMDTEETIPGSEEEWGKPGSVYTCSLLQNAESIIIQTDPNAFLDAYGRLLGWIWIQLPDEEEYFLLNYMVVKQGLAQVKYEFGAGETMLYGDHYYNEWMHIAEDYAIANELGQWGDTIDYYWNYDLNEPYYERWNTN